VASKTYLMSGSAVSPDRAGAGRAVAASKTYLMSGSAVSPDRTSAQLKRARTPELVSQLKATSFQNCKRRMMYHVKAFEGAPALRALDLNSHDVPVLTVASELKLWGDSQRRQELERDKNQQEQVRQDRMRVRFDQDEPWHRHEQQQQQQQYAQQQRDQQQQQRRQQQHEQQLRERQLQHEQQCQHQGQQQLQRHEHEEDVVMDECKWTPTPAPAPVPLLKRIAQLRAEANETVLVHDSVVTPAPHHLVRINSSPSSASSRRATLHRSLLQRLPLDM
jgi:hypothetical protein